MGETGWAPQVDFEDGLARTINWYRQNAPWVARVKTGEYRTYYALNYENRESELRKTAVTPKHPRA
jgi:dTDP-glucose 4,6-dehydratase